MTTLALLLSHCQSRMFRSPEKVEKIAQSDEKFNATVAQLVKDNVQFMDALETTLVDNKVRLLDAVESTFNSSMDQLLINRQRLHEAKKLVRIALAPKWARLKGTVRESKGKMAAVLTRKWQAIRKDVQERRQSAMEPLTFVPVNAYDSALSPADVYEFYPEDNHH